MCSINSLHLKVVDIVQLVFSYLCSCACCVQIQVKDESELCMYSSAFLSTYVLSVQTNIMNFKKNKDWFVQPSHDDSLFYNF